MVSIGVKWDATVVGLLVELDPLLVLILGKRWSIKTGRSFGCGLLRNRSQSYSQHSQYQHENRNASTRHFVFPIHSGFLKSMPSHTGKTVVLAILRLGLAPPYSTLFVKIL
jgi:hypothetical protein